MGNACTSGDDKGKGYEFDDNMQNASHESVQDKFMMAGQGHVFNGYEDLNETEKQQLIDQCCHFDVDTVDQLYADLVMKPSSNKKKSAANGGYGPSFKPIEQERIVSKSSMNKLNQQMMNAMGSDCIREGNAAVILLAGGQGSRLGTEQPKGMFNIGLPSGKSLFQLHVEKFYKAQLIANDLECDTVETPAGTFVKIPDEAQKCKMLVLTNRENYVETVQFFEKNNYFGGSASSFVFFAQRMLPAIDM